uniref:Putative capsid protein n=1 Tax=viral metagenome TaxID=1070528 RepID=A0A6M3J578_9ZZZZ
MKKSKLSLALGTRTIEGEIVYRELAVDKETVNVEERTVELAASSEYPVERWFGYEILDHSAGSIRLGRLQNFAPLLNMHRLGEQIGVIEAVWLSDDRRLRARVRFSKAKTADEYFQDVIDGIRRHVSIGYLIHEMILVSRADSGDSYRIIDWEPYEISMVSVPADPTVGVGRSAEQTEKHYQNTITVRGLDVPAPNEQTTTEQQRTAPVTQNQQSADPALAERTRISEINAIAEQFGQRTLVADSIHKGHTIDQFRALVMERMAPAATGGFQGKDPLKPGGEERSKKAPTASDLGLSFAEQRNYSLMRAIEASASGNWEKAGFEREVSLAIATYVNKDARGFFVPHDLLQVRGLEKGTPGKGGELVATDLMSGEFIDILRNKAMVAKLGARVLPGLVGDVDLPKKLTGSNFYWLGEKEDVNDSEFDFSTIPLKNRTIAGAVPVTRKLRKQSSIGVENLIREDLIEGIGVAIDLAMLSGAGGNAPEGLLTSIGIPGVVIPAGGIDWATLVEMETKVATFNADSGNLSYLTSPTQRGAAKTRQKFEGTSDVLWANNAVNGYGAHATNQIPADTWAFGDWSQLILALWGVLDLQVDKAKLAAQDGLVLRVFQDCDVGIRRKQSFCIARKA